MTTQETNYIIQKLDAIHIDITDVKIKQAVMENNIEHNTEDLSEHIEGVIQNRKRIAYIESKVEDMDDDINFPKKLANFIIKIAAVVTGIAAVLGVIYSLVQHLN